MLGYQRFGGSQDLAVSIFTLKSKGGKILRRAGILPQYLTAWRHNPEDLDLIFTVVKTSV
jgi:hypothetical protein